MNRRHFLQSSLAAGALSGFHLRAADKAGRKYRTALVGAGWVSPEEASAFER